VTAESREAIRRYRLLSDPLMADFPSLAPLAILGTAEDLATLERLIVIHQVMSAGRGDHVHREAIALARMLREQRR